MSDNLEVVIYKVSSPTGKVYIGLTKDFEYRKKQHIRAAHTVKDPYYNEVFKRAIRKHGNQLKWQIIDAAADYDTAHELEKRYIQHFDSYRRGYNCTLGGDGHSTPFKPRKWTKETILANAVQYKCKTDWYEYDYSAYMAAKRFNEHELGFFKMCIAHMEKKRSRGKPHNFKWTTAKIITEAKKHNNRIEFKSNNSPAYSAMNALRLSDYVAYVEASAHMTYPRSKWNYQELLKTARECEYKSEWEKKHPAAYEYATKRLKKRDLATYNSLIQHMKVKKHGK